MSIYKTEKLSFKNGSEELKIVVAIKISKKDNHFYCNFDKEILEFFEERNVKFAYNSQTGSFSKLSAPTYDALIEGIAKHAKDAISKKEISRVIEIDYCLDTCISYCLTEDKEIVPDGSYAGKTGGFDKYGWQNGTIDSSATYPKPFGVNFYVCPMTAITYEYRSGRRQVERKALCDRDVDQNKYPALHWVCSIRSNAPSKQGPVRTVPYSEEKCLFFKNFFIGLCNLIQAVKGFSDPLLIEEFVKSGQPLKLNA